MMNCENCKRLMRENQQLKRIITRQKRAIESIAAYTIAIHTQAGRAMSEHQPRGTWSLWKGRREVARAVFNFLGRM